MNFLVEKLKVSENEITALNKKVEEQDTLVKSLQEQINTLKQNVKPNPNALLSDTHVWKINQFMKKRRIKHCIAIVVMKKQ